MSIISRLMSSSISTTGSLKRIAFPLLLTLFISGSVFAQYQSYRVQPDETLESIAEKFDVSKAAILSLNPDIKGTQVTGKTVVIPPKETGKKTPTASTVRFKQYHVKPKETLYSLAKRNNISVKDIKRFNPYLYEKELGANDRIRIPIFSNGAENLNASVQTSTFKNLIHVVMPKETKWGIAHKYNMTVKQLDSLNPSAMELHPGQVLKVRNPATENVNEDLFYYYQVKPKETFYSLTRRLEISKDSLVTLNPILKELGLQAGMELKIPKSSGTFEPIKQSKKTLNLAQHLTNFSTKNIAVMLPFNLQKIKVDSVDRKAILKKDQVLQISLDMYSGIKIAIDSVQKLGISVNAQVFDTETSPQKIAAILNKHSFQDTQFIIGPLLANNVKTVAEKLSNKSVAVFSPLTNGDLYSNNNIVQTRPSKLAKQKVLVSYIDSLKAGKNLIILSDDKHEFFAQKFLANFPSARRVIKEKKEYLQRGDLERLLDKNRPNWVILESSKYGDVSNTVTYLNAMLSSYDIRLFTADKNYIYDVEVPGQYLSHLNFTYSSIDKSDLVKTHKNFIKMYKEKYGITPNQYAVRGFDVTFDALLRSASAKSIFKGLEKIEGTTEHVQNRFNYHKKMIGGYYNSAVYLIEFSTNLNLNVLN